jgi:hypothetical protein
MVSSFFVEAFWVVDDELSNVVAITDQVATTLPAAVNAPYFE